MRAQVRTLSASGMTDRITGSIFPLGTDILRHIRTSP
jgi:hypothetical protein